MPRNTTSGATPRKKRGEGAEAPVRLAPSVKPPGSNRQLEGYVDRLQRLENDRREAAAGMSEILNEAETSGFNKRALRAIVKQRMESPEQEATRMATEEAKHSMLSALGMLRDTPLGQAAAAAAGIGGDSEADQDKDWEASAPQAFQ